MSQIYKSLTSGPVPPAVPTSFTTDIGSNPSATPGTAVPVLNNLNLLARDTVDNDLDGIRTNADPNGGSTLYFELTNRTQDAVQTTDATLTTITTFTPPLDGTYAFDFYISAFNTTDSLGAAYRVFVGFLSIGGVATKLNLEDKIVNEQAGMAGCNVTATVSGANFLLQVTGLGGPDKTINWNAVGTYVFVGV